MTDKENEIAIKAMVQNSVKIFAHTSGCVRLRNRNTSCLTTT